MTKAAMQEITRRSREALAKAKVNGEQMLQSEKACEERIASYSLTRKAAQRRRRGFLLLSK